MHSITGLLDPLLLKIKNNVTGLGADVNRGGATDYPHPAGRYKDGLLKNTNLAGYWLSSSPKSICIDYHCKYSPFLYC